jgi:hypothetical protein
MAWLDPTEGLGRCPAPPGVSKDNMDLEHLNNQLPNSTEQVADSCSAGQDMTHVLQTPKFLCRADKNLFLLREQASSRPSFYRPVHALPSTRLV